MLKAFVTTYSNDADKLPHGPSQPAQGIHFTDLAATIPGAVVLESRRMVIKEVAPGTRVCVSDYAFS